MNYTKTLAETLSARAPGIAIYSNVDPTREWNGIKTVEFMETDAETTKFISGDARRRRNIAMAVRSESEEESEQLGQWLKSIFFDALDEILINGDFLSWSYVDEGTAPDSRGVATGESFYWYMNVEITEQIENN